MTEGEGGRVDKGGREGEMLIMEGERAMGGLIIEGDEEGLMKEGIGDVKEERKEGNVDKGGREEADEGGRGGKVDEGGRGERLIKVGEGEGLMKKGYSIKEERWEGGVTKERREREKERKAGVREGWGERKEKERRAKTNS